MVKTISMHATLSEIGMSVYRIVIEVTGVRDPYKNIKQQHIAETKSIYPELEKIMANSEDKLLTAIRIAIAGNVIDLGVKKSFDIVKDVKSILKQDFAIFYYSTFKTQLEKTENILYISDNVGGLSDCNRQIFFLLKTKCPIISNHIGVKGGSIIIKEHKI